jgi:hypothetical protein
MFVKKDYLKYFSEIEATENLMIIRAQDLKHYFANNPSALEMIDGWEKDEKLHKEIAQSLVNLAKKR